MCAFRRGSGKPTGDAGLYQIEKGGVRCQNINTARPGGHATTRWTRPAGATTAASTQEGSGTNNDAVQADSQIEEAINKRGTLKAASPHDKPSRGRAPRPADTSTATEGRWATRPHRGQVEGVERPTDTRKNTRLRARRQRSTVERPSKNETQVSHPESTRTGDASARPRHVRAPGHHANPVTRQRQVLVAGDSTGRQGLRPLMRVPTEKASVESTSGDDARPAVVAVISA